jgi:hypothetical protein
MAYEGLGACKGSGACKGLGFKVARMRELLEVDAFAYLRLTCISLSITWH